MDCLIVCVPGLEAIVAEEARSLGLRLGRRERGALHATGTTRQVYAANLWLRTATRVLMPLASFRATTFGALERGASAIDWGAVIPPGEVPAFRVTSHGSTLFHTAAVAERLARPFGGTGTEAPGDDHPLIVVRIGNDRVEVRADLSGTALHKRGWRRAVGKAPLRESLAAALVLASGWDRRSPLIDPFCGSGTIPIEAALLAADVAPGLGRSFALERWPSFAPGTWASVVGEARTRAERGLERARSSGVPLLVASDRDDGAIAATRANAERARVGDLVQTRRATVSDLVAPSSMEQGWIVTNPPWGGRLADGRSGSRDLRDLYARLGQVVRSLGSGWRAGMLVADERLARHSGLELSPRLSFDDNGTRVSFLVTT